MEEVLAAFRGMSRSLEVVVDGTMGAGGHGSRLLKEHGDTITCYVGMDKDPAAHAIASRVLRAEEEAGRAHLLRENYSGMRGALRRLGEEGKVASGRGADAILLDLGVSSMQLDRKERGFSFLVDGPLDMRMDPRQALDAAAVVNGWDEGELARIFWEYGEERHSRRLARRLVEARREGWIASTGGLVRALRLRREDVPRKFQKDGKHPATRVFQALRIAVNDELGCLEDVLPDAISLLEPGGRLAVISFHSLEDRIVKRAFVKASVAPLDNYGRSLESSARVLTRRPLTAAEEELASNPRSRSAKLRILEKL